MTRFVIQPGYGPDDPRFVIPLEGELLQKAENPKGGPFIGPRGGKWADPRHKIPWKEGVGKTKAKQTIVAKTPGRNWVDHKESLPNQTIQKYRIQGDPPVYKKERQALHQEITESFLRSPTTGKKIAPSPKSQKKIAIVMMGGTASGKTTAVKKMLGVSKGNEIEDKGFVNFNPDDVKDHIPEFQDAKEFEVDGKKTSARDAAWMVHEESSNIAHDIYKRAVDAGLNIVVDGTGKNADKHIGRIRELQERGYEVSVVMTDVDIEGIKGAISRSDTRAERTGRYVPHGPPPPKSPDVLRDIHLQIAVNFERVSQEADNFTLFDSRPFPPVVRWSGQKGKEAHVPDSAWLEQFKARGKEMKEAHDEWQKRKKKNPQAPAPRIEPLEKAMPDPDLTKADTVAPTMTSADWDAQVKTNLKTATGGLYDEEAPKKFPGAGKGGAGIVWPTEDIELDADKPYIAYK